MILYELEANLDTLVDGEMYDANLVVTPELAGKTLVDLSLDEMSKVVIRATSSKVEWTDWVWMDQGWPIVSEPLLTALRSVGDFPHEAVPIQVRAARKGDCDIDKPYFLLQVPLSEGLFDWERSDCERDDLFPEIVDRLDTIVLINEKQTPPIFRMLEWSRLLVKANVAKALAATGLRGFNLNGVGPNTSAVVTCP